MKKYQKALSIFLFCFLIGIFLPAAVPELPFQTEVWAASKLAAPKITSVKANDSSSITIKWNAVPNADGYRIYRKEVDVDAKFKKIKTLTTSNILTYTDKNLKMGSTYTYTVRAYKMVNQTKNWGSYDPAGVSAKTIIPKPASLTAVATGNTTASITWSSISGVNGYRIYRKEVGVDTDWTRIDILSGKNTTTYADTGLRTGRTYAYTVLAYKIVNNKKVLGKYDKTGVAVTTKMTTPKLVSLTSSDSKTATLTWKKTSGVDGYTIYRKTAGSKWCKLKNIKGASSTSYIDTTLVSGVTYTYTVRAYTNIQGNYHRSNYYKSGISVTSKTATIQNIKATANSANITITWKINTKADGYRIYRRTSSDSFERLVTLSGSSISSYTDTTAKAGVTYYYTVRGYKVVNGSKLWGYYNKTGVSAVIKNSTYTGMKKLKSFLIQNARPSSGILHEYYIGRFLYSDEEDTEFHISTTAKYNDIMEIIYFNYEKDYVSYREEIEFQITDSPNEKIRVTYIYYNTIDESNVLAETFITKNTYTGEYQTFTLKEAENLSNTQIASVLTRASKTFDTCFKVIEKDFLIDRVSTNMKELGFSKYIG